MKLPALTALLGCALLIAPTARAQSVDDQGETAVKSGNIDTAISLFSQAIAANPRDARAFYDRAYACSVRRALGQAESDCHAAIEIKPDFARAYCLLGNIAWMKEDREGAERYYNEAISLAPDDSGNWYARGLYNLYRDNDKAIADMSQALRLSPDNVLAWFNRGNAYLHSEKYDSAIADYTQAIKLRQTDGNIFHQRGMAYMKSGDFDHAIPDLTQAIALKPKSDAEYFTRGCAYAGEEQYPSAVADFTQAIQLSPRKNTLYYFQRAQAYLAEGDKTDAAQDFKVSVAVKSQTAQ